jgi:hypothetical protein
MVLVFGVYRISWLLASFVALWFLFGACECGFPPASLVFIAELYLKERHGRVKSFLDYYFGTIIFRHERREKSYANVIETAVKKCHLKMF